MFNFRSDRRAVHPAATPVRRKPSIDFSVTGLSYCGMMMFMGVAAVNSKANLLFGVFGLMIGTLLISGVISRLVLRKITVNRVLPEHATVAQTATIVYEFTNRKRYWPSLSLGLSELDGAEAFTRQPHSYMLHAAPGMTASVPIEVIAKRRGLHPISRYQLSTSFPFGFIKRAWELTQKDSILIYPPLGEVDRKLLSMCRSAETSGASMRPRRGGTDEFYGIKEYRQGDNPRWIYWRRSARTGTLVSREMTQVSPPRLLIMVDTFLPTRSVDHHVAVEHTIAMAASLADHALAAGLSVGICAWTGRWTTLTPNRGKRHRREALSLLACLPLNPLHDSNALLQHMQDSPQPGTTPILITPRDVHVPLADQLRTGLLTLSPASEQTAAFFKFDPSIDFARCMPPDQQPELPDPTRD